MRSLNIARFEEIANDPRIRPSLGGEGPLTFGPLMDKTDVLFFEGPHGGFVVHRIHGTRYECHSMFLPEKSAKAVIRLMWFAMEYMFTRTDCEEIVTKVADDNPGAAWLARSGRFEKQFYRADAWAPGVGVSYYCLSLDTWAAACSTVREEGAEFHRQLEKAKLAAGSELPAHPEDEVHDITVGATVLMLKAGNVLKGINHYNRWAVFAGYVPVLIISEQPPVLNVGHAIVEVQQGRMEVVKCL